MLKNGRNRTLKLTAEEKSRLLPRLHKKVIKAGSIKSFFNKIFCHDSLSLLQELPADSVDLIIADPPYNITKKFNALVFNKKSADKYIHWLRPFFQQFYRILKPGGTLYICAEWQTSYLIQTIAEDFFITQNRITWEREKGRGAKSNFKNSSEDIWFFTKSKEYFFDVNAVKVIRKVIAPYKNIDGQPKDWKKTEHGNLRETYPSNLWTDITVPFWSMPENTEHPTQKPEKLIAKLILASSKKGDVVLDPFLGSGTTAVVAKKLKRNYIGIELDPDYCYLALKRLDLADKDSSIQGYHNERFYERNTTIPRKN